MPAVWQRHSRYALLIVLMIFTTTYLLLGYEPPARPIHDYIPPSNHELPVRLSRSDRMYDRMLEKRREMIRRFGPTPAEVVMFPPDKKPWPAYTVWDFFPPAFDCPHEVERIGNMGDGGKWFCGLSRIENKPDCVIYTIGFSYETSFEKEILDRTSECRIWAYDKNVKKFPVQRGQSHRTRFERFGLAGGEHETSATKTVKLYTLDGLMKMNGHNYVDVLKVDAEGGEFPIFTAFLEKYAETGEPLPFGQLLLEIHLWSKKFPEMLAFWELLEKTGLRPYRSEPNLVYQNYNKNRDSDLAEYSFINIKGTNMFNSDPVPSESASSAVTI